MLTDISGGFEKTKVEMKQAYLAAIQKVKSIRKQYKKGQALSQADQKRVSELERLQDIYASSKTLPARVEDSIINYKTYQTFMKKLAKFDVSVRITPSRDLEVSYSEKNGKAKGVLTLYDLSPYFEAFTHIPIVKIQAE